MDYQKIYDKINFYIDTATECLADWLKNILSLVSDSLWDECILPNLSCSRCLSIEKNNISNLSDLTLSELSIIVNKLWIEISHVIYISPSKRDIFKDLANIRLYNCNSVLDKERILQDLNRIYELLSFTDHSSVSDLELFIAEISQMENNYTQGRIDQRSENRTTSQSTTIKVNSLIHITAFPETKGVVVSVKDLGSTVIYNVFVNNSIQSYFPDQIEPEEIVTDFTWTSIERIRVCLTAYQINNPSSGNLYSLNAARIDFVPYQFRPALKLIHADEPRILIADSVGVGKTIEAGLIIKELEARGDLSRIVIICPRPLVAERKWEDEMKRFDEDFIPLNGRELRQIISETDRDGEWPARYGKVIIPYSILDSRAFEGYTEGRTRSFGLRELDPEPHFDLVIVDEAHHIRNGSEDKLKAFAYKCTKYFCDHADAVVMLTATPIQTGNDDLYTLLNVLRPDIIIDKGTFSYIGQPNKYITNAVKIVRASGESWQGEALEELQRIESTYWGDQVIKKNPMYHSIIVRLKQNINTRSDRVRLISDIESLNSFSTMINRTRRRDIQDFCTRRPTTLSVSFTDYQKTLYNELISFETLTLSILHDERSIPFMLSTIKRQTVSCIFGLAPYFRDMVNRRLYQICEDPDSEYFGIELEISTPDVLMAKARRLLELSENLPEEDPKIDEILKVIKLKQEMPNNKIMIFSTFRHTLAYLRKKLSALGYRVEQVDGSVKDEMRYLLKDRFERPRDDESAIDILLFTEVGSEGLDYQFCDMIINYDLPWNPMRIEQRIGRIDRRGQKSQVVNIYNVITEDTIDADIYYRCLSRIGVFESSIGECEEILGEVAKKIQDVALDNDLTAEERKKKLEQIADNEVRKVQELSRLEQEEKELFGLDISDFIASDEIRRAENPWLLPICIRRMIEQYLSMRLGHGSYILGSGTLKTLRLSVEARTMLREDMKKLSGGTSVLRSDWDAYLKGNARNHPLTFDQETAADHRDSFFITTVHPLARQAAEFFADNKTAYVKLGYISDDLPAGRFLFSIYAWNIHGYNPYTRIIAICENEVVEADLIYIIEHASDLSDTLTGSMDWSDIERRHYDMWEKAKAQHKEQTEQVKIFRLESLESSRIKMLQSMEKAIATAAPSMRQVKIVERDNKIEMYNRKASSIEHDAPIADIFSTLLVNGVIVIEKES